MLACKQATQLASAAMDRKLSMTEQIQLRVHLAICNGCRNFSRQIDLLRQISKRHADQDASDDEK